MTSIQSSIARVRRRVFANRLLANLGWAVLIGLVAAALVMVADKLLPLTAVPLWVYYGIAGAGVVVSFALALGKLPGEADAAVLLDDKLKLKDSLGTAMYAAKLEQQNELTAQIAREAEEAGQRARTMIGRAAPITVARVWQWTPIAAAVLLGVLFLMPENAADPLGQVAAAEQEAKEQALAEKGAEVIINTVQQDVSQDEADKEQKIASGLPDELQDQLVSISDEVRKNPSAAAEKLKEAESLVSDAEDRLGEQVDVVEAAFNPLRSAASGLDAGQPGPADAFTKAMNRGDFEQAKDAIEKLQEQIDKGAFDQQTRQQLQQQLNNLSQQLNQQAQQAQQRQQQATSQAQQNLQQQLQNSGMSASQAQQLAQQVAQQAAQQMQQQQQQQNGQQGQQQNQQAQGNQQQGQQQGQQAQQGQQGQQANQQGQQQAQQQLQQALQQQGMSQQQAQQQAQQMMQQMQQAQQQAQGQQQSGQMQQQLSQGLRQMAGQCNNPGGQQGQQGQQAGQQGQGQQAGQSAQQAINQMAQMQQQLQRMQQQQQGMQQAMNQLNQMQQGGHGQGQQGQQAQGGGQGPGAGTGDGGNPYGAQQPGYQHQSYAANDIQQGEGRVIASWTENGEATAGEATVEFNASRTEAVQSAERAVTEDRVPRRYHESIKAYFQQLPEDPNAGRAPAAPR